jgi:hypothetical protein
MSATPVSQIISADPHKDPRGRRRPVGYDRAAPLKPIDLETHKQLLGAHQIMSGRCRGYVYSWRKGKLHKRRYVVPKDPRTPTQQRSRAAFGAASKAWSENNTLTQEQRDAWYAEAAKIKSRPRLGQSGPLTAQQHIVGSNSLKERWGLQLLLEPPGWEKKKLEARMQNTQSSAQVPQPQRVVRPTWEPRRACPRPAPDLRAAAKACAQESIGRYVTPQVLCPRRLTRPSSDPPQTASRPLPVHCRWQAGSPSRLGSTGLPHWPSTLAHLRRSACFRELWRGG